MAEENAGLSAEDLALLGEPERAEAEQKAAAEAAAKVEAEKAAADAAGKTEAEKAAKAEADKKTAEQQQQQAQDWRASISDDKLKNVAARVASPSDAMKLIVDLRTEISQRIKLPGENATDEDKAKYRKAMGVPDDVKGYKIDIPEGVEVSELDQEIVDQALPLALEAGAPAGVVNKLMGGLLKLNHEMRTAATKAIEDFGNESSAALKKEWGKDYEPNVNLAKRFVEVHGGPEFKDFLNSTKIEGGGALGDHPMIVKMMATLGRRTDEGDLMIGNTQEERTSIQTQIDELLAKTPPGTAGYTSPAFQKQLTALFGQLHGNAPIVGAAGRSA